MKITHRGVTYISAAEAVAEVGVKLETARKWARAGAIPSRKVRGRLFLAADALLTVSSLSLDELHSIGLKLTPAEELAASARYARRKQEISLANATRRGEECEVPEVDLIEKTRGDLTIAEQAERLGRTYYGTIAERHLIDA